MIAFIVRFRRQRGRASRTARRSTARPARARLDDRSRSSCSSPSPPSSSSSCRRSRTSPRRRRGAALQIKVEGTSTTGSSRTRTGGRDRPHARAGRRARELVGDALDSDVIHSWWIPARRQDRRDPRHHEPHLVPGREDGSYEARCAELCGLEHAHMIGPVDVVSRPSTTLPRRAHARTARHRARPRGSSRASAPRATASPARATSGRRSTARDRSPTRGARANLLRNGKDKMPAVGAGWTDEQIEAATDYLQENPPVAVKAEPSRTRPGSAAASRAGCTTDHKRIGILYISQPRLLPPRAGSCRSHARAARDAERALRDARPLQRALHDPRDDDGLPGRRPDPRRVRRTTSCR